MTNWAEEFIFSRNRKHGDIEYLQYNSPYGPQRMPAVSKFFHVSANGVGEKELNLMIAFLNPSSRQFQASVEWKVKDESQTIPVTIRKVKKWGKRNLSDRQLCHLKELKNRRIEATVRVAMCKDLCELQPVCESECDES